MRERKSGEAKKLIEERGDKISPKTWEVRLTAERGDYMAVWREKLISYYLGKLPEKDIKDISDTLEDADRFSASPLAKAEMSRSGFLCEWRFYDALLQSVPDDPTTRRTRMLERLRKVIETKEFTFWEYAVARDLIRRMDQGEDFTLGP